MDYDAAKIIYLFHFPVHL